MRKMMLSGITLMLVLAAAYQSGLAQENQKKAPVVAEGKAATKAAVVAGERAATKGAEKVPVSPPPNNQEAQTDDWAQALKQISGGGDQPEDSIKRAATSIDTTEVQPKAEGTPVCTTIEWLSSKREYSRYFPSLNGTWLQIQVRNNCNRTVSSLTARVSIPDRLHDAVFDTVKVDFERLSWRQLDPGKTMVLEAQLGDYRMPGNWQYGQKIDGRSVEVIAVVFKDGSVWRK